MVKAPFVCPRVVKTGRVFDVRPTPKLLKYLPHLKREGPFENLVDANAVGLEWSRLLDKALSGETGPSPYSQADTVHRLINSYLNSMKYKNINSPKTRRSYLGHIRYVRGIQIQEIHQLDKAPKETFESMKTSDVTYRYLHDLWMHIKNDVSVHKANHTFKVLKLIWKDGLATGRVKANPFPLVRLPALPARQVMWTKDEIDKMVKFCDDEGYPSMGTMIVMGYHWCQRVVDVRQRTWDEISTMKDPQTGKEIEVIRFTQQKTRNNVNPARMSLQITPAIRKRMDISYKSNIHPYIISYEGTGKPYSDDRAVKVFRRLAKKFNLREELWLNDLRRTGTTHASQNGATDRELVALTGHKNPSLLVVYAVTGQIEASNALQKRGLIERA
tara:strand:+ start:338 stop:1498 length:1161 start_codon:yes stop_codon:yes gene_type:complete